jgi:hypothetical protein
MLFLIRTTLKIYGASLRQACCDSSRQILFGVIRPSNLIELVCAA